MSLKDTYQSRKNLLATNLTAQGVTASGSEGLTSLIDKVLDISGGGGAVVDTLTIATDKTILSSVDSETATITVTAYDSNNDPVPNAKILLFTDTTYYDTITTNNNGIATKTYNATAKGEINIYAVTTNTITNMIHISDYYKYDDCSTDKTSNYTVQTGASFTFDTDHYVMAGDNNGVLVASELDNVQFEVLLKHNNNAGGITVQQTTSFGDNTAGLYNNTSNTTYFALFPWQSIKSQNNVTNNNNYYRYILQVQGSSVTARVENISGTSLFEGTTTKSLTSKNYYLFTPSNSMNVKEIVIKPLTTS